MYGNVDPGVAVGLVMAWSGIALIALVFLLMSALRVLSNGFRTSRQLADTRLRAMSLIAAVFAVVTASTAFLIPVVAVLAGLVWPLALARVESRLQNLGRGTNAHYTLALGTSLAFFGFSAVGLPVSQLATLAISRPWLEVGDLWWALYGAALMALALNGAVMLVAAVGLLRLRSATQDVSPRRASAAAGA